MDSACWKDARLQPEDLKSRMSAGMNTRTFLMLLVCAVCLSQRALAQENPADSDAVADRQAIEAVLHAQADAWNRGDIDRFMDGYAKTPELRFASGGTVTRGWQETLARYHQHYPDRSAMGTLDFSDLDTTVLSANTALVFGRWRLKTDHGEPNGLFTLLLRKTADGWRIVADHTSAAAG